MSRKNNVFGFAISPTHIHGVRLSVKQFTVDKNISKELAHSTISHDGKRVIDIEFLQETLAQISRGLGSNQQSEESLFLSVHAPWMGFYRGVYKPHSDIEEQIIDFVMGTHIEDSLDRWIVEYELLREEGNDFEVVYAIVEKSLLIDISKAFNAIGLQIEAVDIIPFSILRAMAGSGVLDALLEKIGNDAVWGCIGLCGSQTWVTLWQGATLQYITTFSTPHDGAALQKQILRIVENSGLATPKIWFAWQESDLKSPIQLLKLNLKAPVRPAQLGPWFQKKGASFPISAVGSALKAEVLFPFGWNFLNESVLVDAFARDLLDDPIEPPPPPTQRPVPQVRYDADTIPQTKITVVSKASEEDDDEDATVFDSELDTRRQEIVYIEEPVKFKQPVYILPRLFLIFTVMLFVGVIAASVYLRIQNQKFGSQEKVFADAFSQQWQSQKTTNSFYATAMPWVKDKVLSQPYPVESVRITKDGTIILKGMYDNTQQVDELLNQLSATDSQPEGLVHAEKSAAPLEQGLQFKVYGRLQTVVQPKKEEAP